MKIKILFAVLMVLTVFGCNNQNHNTMKTNYKRIQIDDCNVFYREAGEMDKPVILLLHGFPSSSSMFRELIPQLSDNYRVIAPDFPGFGQTESPERGQFDYTFEHITDIVEKFTEKLGLTKFSMYVFDYGAPIGYRLAMRNPKRISAIISQNGNMYDEGLGKKWAARKEYWKNPNDSLRKQFSSAFALETIKGQYEYGTPENSVAPDNYLLDFYYVSLPGRDEIQNDLILDYRTNVALYPDFQKYLRDNRPPLLAVWGENDPSFIPEGAKAFKKDLPESEIHFVPSGHFALESHCTEIAGLIKEFLGRKL